MLCVQLYVWCIMFDNKYIITAVVSKHARTIATDEKSIAELKKEEKEKEKVTLYWCSLCGYDLRWCLFPGHW